MIPQTVRPLQLCTKGRGRRVDRGEKEAVIERMAERLAKRPDILVIRHPPSAIRHPPFAIRHSTGEHPFGTIKQSMNQGAFLMRGLAPSSA